MEAIDMLGFGCGEGKMEALSGDLHLLLEVEEQNVILAGISIAYGFIAGEDADISKGGEHGVVEGSRAIQIGHGDRKMVQQGRTRSRANRSQHMSPLVSASGFCEPVRRKPACHPSSCRCSSY